MDSLPSPTVNFFIVGAQKCGTTALWSYLAGHPDICMARGREVHLFDLLDTACLHRDRLDRFYAGYFDHYRGEALRGESTPAYLYHPTAVAEIRRYNPRAKLIVLLRDPVERALSHYAMERSVGRESWPLSLALLLEPLRLLWFRLTPGPRIRPMFCSYIDRGRYRRQLRRLRAAFPEEQVLVLDSQALDSAHETVLRRVYAFLGVAAPAPLPPAHRKFETPRKYRPGPLTALWLQLRLGRERRWLRSRGRLSS